MNWKLAFSIASAHLLTKKKQSIVAMLGVMFGISMFIIMISFMTGVNRFLDDLAMDNTPHIHIYNPVEIHPRSIVAEINNSADWYVTEHQRPKNTLPKIKNGLKLKAQIEAIPEVLGVAPQASSQVFFNNGPLQIPGLIFGIDVREQVRLFDLDQRMDEGQPDILLRGSDMVLMGKGLANKMNMHTGDRVSVTTPQGGNFSLKIGGIFSYGIAAMDESRAYTSLATVQKILGEDPAYVTDLNIKLHDPHRSAEVKKKLRGMIRNVKVEDWEEANASILAGDKIRNILTAVVCITLLTVAGFGIYNIMNMNIINKMKDIAILKATGFTGADITAIFLFQSLMIGVLGGALGLLFGFFVSYLLSITPFPAGEIIRLKTFPVNFRLSQYAAGLFFGFLTTLFAGYFPSRRAAKLDPVQIIRG